MLEINNYLENKYKYNIIISTVIAFIIWYINFINIYFGEKITNLILCIISFIYPEIMIFIYVFLSVIKGHIVYKSVFSDPVILILASICLRLIFNILTNEKKRFNVAIRELAWPSLFCIIIFANIFRVSYYNWDNYSFQKIIRFIITDFSLLFIIYFSINNYKDFVKYFNSLFIVLVALPLYSFIGIFNKGTKGLSFYVSDNIPTIDFSFYLGILIVYLISSLIERKNEILKLVLLMLSCFAMILVNERNTVIALLVTLFLGLFFNINRANYSLRLNKKIFKLILFIFLIVLIVLVVIFVFSPERYYSRYLNFSDNSILQRKNFIEISFIQFLNSPIIGNGPNSFMIKAFGSDIDGSPHIIFLEILCEFGLIGFIPFFIFIIKLFRKSYNSYKYTIFKSHFYDYKIVFLFYVFLYTFIKFCISSRLNGYRWFWILSGFIIIEDLLVDNNKSIIEKCKH